MHLSLMKAYDLLQVHKQKMQFGNHDLAIEMDEDRNRNMVAANNISICNSKTITIQAAASPADITSTQKLAGPSEMVY